MARPLRFQRTLTTLSATFIYTLVHRFCQLHPLPKTRGRPPRHPEALILTLALLRTRDRASYRRLLFALAPNALPDHPLPALGTLVYRLHHIPEERWHQLVAWLAQQGRALEPPTTATPYALVDGTGIGYAVPLCARFLRGAVVRQLRAHVKVVVVGYWQGGRVWVVGVAMGQAYADEGKLLSQWVAR
ncbi:MAG: hypothetical protein NZM28_10230 [Fimbriimonadales bacterium]|nr:hypothetical protein [Fimbriimonadales bacterium]